MGNRAIMCVGSYMGLTGVLDHQYLEYRLYKNPIQLANSLNNASEELLDDDDS